MIREEEMNLNNKRQMQGYISSMSVCLSVCPRFFSETAELSNMPFAQLYWCGNSNDNQAFILKFCQLFLK